VARETFSISTDGNAAYDITPLVQRAIEQSAVNDGLAVVWIPHTTASVAVISFPDPKGLEDVIEELARLVPTRIDFKHQHDTPQDAAGHVKSAIVGTSLTVIVEDHELLLGHSQKLYLLEFDGPRERQVYVKAIRA
jgi:secondary thiamine-phosphate synthase enzyme